MNAPEIGLLLAPYLGQTYLGLVDGNDCLEFVFSDPYAEGGNLLTIFRNGRVAHGYVDEPETYVNAVVDGGFAWTAE